VVECRRGWTEGFERWVVRQKTCFRKHSVAARMPLERSERRSNDCVRSSDGWIGRSVIERYRYDAYGEVTVLDADGSVDADGLSDVRKPYLFTARSAPTSALKPVPYTVPGSPGSLRISVRAVWPSTAHSQRTGRNRPLRGSCFVASLLRRSSRYGCEGWKRCFAE